MCRTSLFSLIDDLLWVSQFSSLLPSLESTSSNPDLLPVFGHPCLQDLKGLLLEIGSAKIKSLVRSRFVWERLNPPLQSNCAAAATRAA